jgi:alcohol dehydrogenase, propanol-preferring
MRAMLFEKAGQPLRSAELTAPQAGAGQVLIRVRACAVCRTDLHITDGELNEPKLPLIPGHEIIGVVEKIGDGVSRFKLGDRVGVPWLGWTCDACELPIRPRKPV